MLSRRLGPDRTGASAVEFALVAPILVLFFVGIVSFSTLFSLSSGLQQLAAESARASVAGLTDSDRTSMVQSFINANIGAYPFLQPKSLSIATSAVTVPSPGFRVSLTYDLSSLVGTPLGTMLPAGLTRLQRSAVVLTSSSL